MTEILTLPVEPKSVSWNPSLSDLRRFTEEMPNCRKTEFGNVNVATGVELESFEPKVTVIYTPNLKAEGYPDDRLIAVDLENYITRVLNSDYFGESKKGGLRMWNKIVYERGGLALHSGCKVIPVKG